MISNQKKIILFTVFATLVVAVPETALAADAKTVPWVSTNPLIPHDSWSGKQITLKGTCDAASTDYTWNPGDGNPAVSAPIGNPFVVELQHTYTGNPGDIFTASLTCTDGGGSDTANYLVLLHAPPPNLAVEANVAVDEGLWYLHKRQNRYVDGGTGLDFGDWTGGGFSSSFWLSVSAANVNAFESNGHLESGDPNNPYTDTVARGLRYLFSQLNTVSIGSQTNGLGTFEPDTNGDSYAVRVTQYYELYQGGMVMDAIVASLTPGAIATTGPIGSAPDPGIRGRSYSDIVQDMSDYYGYCQYDGAGGGGWRYVCNEFPDNSSCQWGAIGLIAAERNFGSTIPQIVKDWNAVWLATTQAADGSFGYTSTFPIWGPYATTPSGGVQLAMDGIGRGDPRWDNYETFMRDNFGNTGGPSNAVRDYYYGLFSFTKSMLLHDSNGDGIAEPIVLLQSGTPGVPAVDWYNAEVSAGDPFDGVARTLINDQTSAGYWYGNNVTNDQFSFETAWAIIMLNRTVFEPVPVAVASAAPNPALASDIITFDGTASFHQDVDRSIVLYEWDFDDDGVFDATGAIATHAFGALGIYPVTLRVTDDNPSPKTDTATVDVSVTIPPVGPTANAGGPYLFCADRQPWRLDGTGSVNPDEGVSLPPAPGDTIQEYAWELDGDNSYNDALGASPDVTAFFTGLGIGDYLVQLRVTDTTASSFPGSGEPDLSDIDSAEVRVRPAGDPLCTAVLDGRMTGGGRVLPDNGPDPKLTHGFTLQCDETTSPNNLEITWNKGESFHLTELVSATCIDDPSISEGTPAAGFDTYAGSGLGRLNGVPGARAQWTFTDAGEPGKNDRAIIIVRNSGGSIVLAVTGVLNNGNQQAHPQN